MPSVTYTKARNIATAVTLMAELLDACAQAQVAIAESNTASGA
jgi:hypothetical protein